MGNTSIIKELLLFLIYEYEQEKRFDLLGWRLGLKYKPSKEDAEEGMPKEILEDFIIQIRKNDFVGIDDKVPIENSRGHIPRKQENILRSYKSAIKGLIKERSVKLNKPLKRYSILFYRYSLTKQGRKRAQVIHKKHQYFISAYNLIFSKSIIQKGNLIAYSQHVPHSKDEEMRIKKYQSKIIKRKNKKS